MRLITASAAATTAFGFWLGDTDRNLAAVNVAAIDTLDSRFGFLLRSHFYKCEAALSPSFTVCRNGARNDFSVLTEDILQFIFGNFEGEISHEQLVIHYQLPNVDLA